MVVMAGQKIGPYEILGQIGAGGMGVVHRARDPRLGREVAIKVLPASFSADPERLQRFEQEARAAAALNHPNIVAVFDIGESGGAPYVVSELLEGETLRERLRTGAMSTRKATDYALQITRGLAAAHEKGIVHRDLKPENLFITHDNRIKILDFGLAKFTRPEVTTDSGDAPTLQVATDPGYVMGTVGYMSPEQVRAKTADHRSDLFAFGAILYEMLSGKRAFHGETPADTMSAILKEDPPELSETGRNISPALARIVNHCLEKSPAQRFQSASDVAFALDSLTDVSSSSKSGLQPVPVGSRSWLMPALAALALFLAGAATYFLGFRVSRYAPPSFHRLTFRRGTIMAARFSPDGQTIVYGQAVEGRPVELFSTRFDSTDSRPLDLARTQLLGISSTGEMAVLLKAHSFGAFMETGTLAHLPLAGGAPREVLDAVTGADWTADGSDLAVIHGGAMGRSNRLEFPVGNIIYRPQGWVSHVRFSRSGDLLAFADHVPNGDDGRVVVIDRNGNHKVASSFYSSVEGLAWSPHAREVWFTASPGGAARALYALTASGKERLVLRVPGTLTLHDISRDGRVLLGEDVTHYGIIGLAPGEKAEKDLSWFDWSVVNDLSSDGKKVVFSESGEAVGANYGIFIRKTDGSPAVRLGSGGSSALSPDGKWVAATVNGSSGQIQLLPTGPGQPRRIGGGARHERVAWTPDGKGLILIGAEPNHSPQSYWMDLEGKSRPVTPEGTIGLVSTADSKYLLAADGEEKWSLFPLTGGGDPQPLRTNLEAADLPVQFQADGKVLIVAQSGVPERVYRIHLDQNRREEILKLIPPDPAGLQEVRGLYLSADEKSYVYSYYRVLSDLWVVDGLK
jgi:serine/threonine protein kinase/WD40 repeat protein